MSAQLMVLNVDNKISFIIPHYGREEMLRQTLESIGAQEYDSSNIDVIVVTQNAELEPSTLDVIATLPCQVLQRPESDTISRMRNVGVESAKGEILAFLDADVHIAKDWILRMGAALEENPRRVIVSAVQTCDDKAPVLEKIRTELSNVSVDCNLQFLPGRNLFLKRDTFEKSGGFPEHLVTCEDYFFTQKVAEQGELYYSSSSNYVHLGEDKEFDLMFKKEIWRGQSNLFSLKGRKVPLSEVPSFLVPVWFSLFAVAFVLAFVFFQKTYALLFFLLALFPVVLYSWRLFNRAEGRLPLMDIVRFYAFYFPARFIGTVAGLFKIVKP